MRSDFILQESIVRSTKILAGKNVRVIMEGFAPRVIFDTKSHLPVEIILPMLPDNCPLPLVNAIKGYQDHEAFHILYSSSADICDSSKDRVWHYLHNMIDDNHINARGTTAFPGTHIEIFNGYKYIHENLPAYEDGYITRTFALDEKPAMAGFLTSWVSRKMESDFQSVWFDKSPLPELMKPLDDALPEELAALFKKCDTPSLVREATDLLLDFVIDMDLYEHLDKIASKDDKAFSSGGKSEKDEDDEEGKGSGGGEDEDDDKEAEEGPSSMENDLAKAIGRNIAQEFEKKKDGFFWTTRNNEVITGDDYLSSPSSPIRNFDTKSLSEFDNLCKEQSNYLRKKLERMLESRNRVYYTGGFRSGKLHQKNLATIPLGNEAVFARKNDIRSLNAAVSLLCDLSGSMRGPKVGLAAQSTYTLADCLEKLKIPFEALGFWTDGPVKLDTYKLRAAFEKFSKDTDPEVVKRVMNRCAAETTFIFKDFDEGFGLKQKVILQAAAASKIGLMNNNDVTHLKVALERLSKRPQEKKVLFVFSDGQPAFSEYDSKNYAATGLRTLAKNAKRDYGVTIVGIGIQSDAVNKFYDNSLVIHELKELPSAVFEVLSKQLLSGK